MQDAQLGRIKLKMDKTIREINQVVINPEIPSYHQKIWNLFFVLWQNAEPLTLNSFFT
ncbi:hypothetical protein [Terasakiella sp.]|uniref:hypothetical protein n=1 Tax=Terasakiella sp. TaxID=2034861 RepID=UPI003AFFE929